MDNALLVLILLIVVLGILILWISNMHGRIGLLEKEVEALKKRNAKENTSTKSYAPLGQMPFSEPMPGEKPVPPILMPGEPVVSPKDPSVKPIRYPYENKRFEHFYSPVNGTVAKVNFNKGDWVKKGEAVLSIYVRESEVHVISSCTGELKQVNYIEGDQVKQNDLLFYLMN